MSRRLAHLTEAGLFERQLYNEKPPRHEYVLTDMGRDFFPVVATLFTWGNIHLAPKGEALLLADRKTERPLKPIMVDADSKARITSTNVVLIPGPRPSRGMLKRLASIKALRPAASSLEERG